MRPFKTIIVLLVFKSYKKYSDGFKKKQNKPNPYRKKSIQI